MIPLLFLLLAADAPLPTAVRDAEAAGSNKVAAMILDAAAREEEDPFVFLYAGEAQRLLGNAKPARAYFERVAADFPSSPASEAAKLGMAVVDARGTPGGNNLASLQLLRAPAAPRTLEADRWLLLAAAAQGTGDASEARAALKKALAAADGTREAKRVTRAADELRARLGSEPKPVAAADEPADLQAIGKVRTALAEGRFADARVAVEVFLRDHADSPLRREAEYALRRADAKQLPDRRKIAVLLPLTGDFAIPGGNLRAAVEMGLADHATLLVRDTAGKADTCVSALEKAVLEEGASVVIGPLTRDEALPCAAAAQALRVPMLTLTTAEEALSAGDHVFRPSPSTNQQIHALLDEVSGVRMMSKFAILHPRTPFGENAARAFVADVTARGGSIVATLAYDAEAKDFRSLGKELGRKDYKARASEFYQVKKEIERAGGDPDKATLPPLIDFDAIFIPDSYQRAALIASALAFEEFPVGIFRPKRESTPVPLLGLNAWNNDEWPRRGGNYVVDSIFVDAFDARSQDPAVVSFVENWRARGQGEPTVVEAVGYDTARLVALALQSDLPELRSAIAAAELPNPVAGTTGIGADRQARRTWRVLTVTREGIRPLGAEPAPIE